jgi:hypothetical protein
MSNCRRLLTARGLEPRLSTRQQRLYRAPWRGNLKKNQDFSD